MCKSQVSSWLAGCNVKWDGQVRLIKKVISGQDWKQVRE